ncbi:MAG: GNAT family N-acetyltransferase, partial [Pseudomonadota bacterium]
MAIETQRLVLRAPDQGDVLWIAREIANPRVHQWLAGPPRPFREADAVAWVRDVQPNTLIRLITRDGQRQGVVGIRHSDTGPRLGYWLAEAAWGQGIMTEAARALAEAFFQTHDGPLFSGWIDGNAGSQNVLAKLGFRE